MCWQVRDRLSRELPDLGACLKKMDVDSHAWLATGLHWLIDFFCLLFQSLGLDNLRRFTRLPSTRRKASNTAVSAQPFSCETWRTFIFLS